MSPPLASSWPTHEISDSPRVFAWSFYSQGTQERVTSADEFISHALGWFGDETRGEGLSPWDRGQRLAELVQEKRTLLLLDGLEPLQSGQAFDRGKIKDPRLEVLLDELGRSNPGLCLISTREQVCDLWHNEDECQVGQFDLETISTTAGRALLRVSGIEGENAALERAVKDFGQHAYAIKLLGSFLTWSSIPHIKHSGGIPDLPDVEEKDGKHPRRVMAAFAERFGDSAKSDILAMLGLFDRPADAGCISALREKPAVPGLNAAALPISEATYQAQIDELRHLGLLTPVSHHAPNELDAHPLVREHFGLELSQKHPEAWRIGHFRLYEYFNSLPQKEQPDTLNEMIHLYRAITHACEAKAFLLAIPIYAHRIHRSFEFYGWRKHGSYSMDLAALAGFFDKSSNNLVDDAPITLTPIVLNPIGFCTCAIGYPEDAVPILRNAWKHVIKPKPQHDAGAIIINLSEALLGLGILKGVKEEAGKGRRVAESYSQIFLQLVSIATLANAEHHMGNYLLAANLFAWAEEIQSRHRPNFPKLYSLRGYYYFDFLLSTGQIDKAEKRASWLLEVNQIRSTLGKLDLALGHLACGRAAAATGNLLQADEFFDRSVDNFRLAGDLMRLPAGLLARAAYRARFPASHVKAFADLKETMRIARRGKMRLFECDAHLEYARLEIKEGRRGKVIEHVTSAEALVSACGYHRRDVIIRSGPPGRLALSDADCVYEYG